MHMSHGGLAYQTLLPYSPATSHSLGTASKRPRAPSLRRNRTESDLFVGLDGTLYGHQYVSPLSNIKGRLVCRSEYGSPNYHTTSSTPYSISGAQYLGGDLVSSSASSSVSSMEEEADVLEVSPTRQSFYISSPQVMAQNTDLEQRQVHPSSQYGYHYYVDTSSALHRSWPELGSRVHDSYGHADGYSRNSRSRSHTPQPAAYETKEHNGLAEYEYEDVEQDTNNPERQEYNYPPPVPSPPPLAPAASHSHSHPRKASNTTPTGTIRVAGQVITTGSSYRRPSQDAEDDQPPVQSAFFGWENVPRGQRPLSSTGTGTELRRGLLRPHAQRRHSDFGYDDGASEQHWHSNSAQHRCQQCNGEGCKRSLAMQEYLQKMERDNRPPAGHGMRSLRLSRSRHAWDSAVWRVEAWEMRGMCEGEGRRGWHGVGVAEKEFALGWNVQHMDARMHSMRAHGESWGGMKAKGALLELFYVLSGHALGRWRVQS
ncbi:hypothetical protein BDZ91DRAFT_762271 [Kalaharituber pfeilii]|nr:hypothetical protein BDZ91DRAFT_762271 [Kalaharituber pfeilii]